MTVPVGSNAGFSDASFSSDVSARGPVVPIDGDVAPRVSPSNTRVVTGTISAAKVALLPALAIAFSWLASANASWSARLTLNSPRDVLGGVRPSGCRPRGIARPPRGLSGTLLRPSGSSTSTRRRPTMPGIDAAGGDAIGDDGDRLQARGAEAVDGHGRDARRAGRPESRRGGRRSTLFGLGLRAAEDDVLDRRGLDLGAAQAPRLTTRAAESVGAGVLERAPCARGRRGFARRTRMATSRMVRFLSSEAACFLEHAGSDRASLASPHSDRNASRSRSRMCCSLTAAPAGTSPPDRTRARCRPIWRRGR